jgi:phosphomannomutase/phosphoglucomutase
MFKKKRSEIGTETARAGGGSVMRRAALLFCLVALVILVFGVASQLLQQREDRQRNAAQSRLLAQVLAGHLSDRFAVYRAILERIGQNPALAQLLSAEDWQGLRQQERHAARLLPEVLRLRFLPLEWDKLEPDDAQPLSYASLDMFRLVEKSEKPAPAEVHQIGSERQYVALAAPIVDPASGTLAGVAHMALPYRSLHGALAGVAGHAGQLQVQQLTAEGTVSLLASGAEPEAARDGEVAVPGSIWQVAYWRASETPTAADLLWSWGLLGIALLVIGLLILLCGQRLKSALIHDRGEFLELVRGLLQQGAVQRQPVAGLRELQQGLDQLVKLGLEQGRKPPAVVAKAAAEAAPAVASGAQPELLQPEKSLPVPAAEIFRAYDIRGVAGETLTADGVYQIGRAIGSEALEQGQQTVIIARDGRLSSDELCQALGRGLVDSGRDVVDLGQVPTPVLYFATHFLGSDSGVMVTGSHNPPEYNGLKAVINGNVLSGDAIQALRRRIEDGDLLHGKGQLQRQDLVPDYIARIREDVQLLQPLKLVLDCGNGAASVIAPALFRALGCETVDLYCEVDGSFPNHHPDPGNPDNMRALISAVRERKADLGLAFDGDGDRLGVVDSNGKIIWPDRLLMLLARDVLLRHPGSDVIYDIKSSRHLAAEILAYGGRPIMWKSGHSLMKEKIRESGALLAAEMSGHIYFKERWYGFDDALYAGARLLEVLSAEGLGSAELFAQLPESASTPELSMATAEGENFALVSQFAELGPFADAKLVTIDGLRAEFSDGWGLVRASNTAPAVTFRFEADSPQAIERIQELFRDRFAAIDPSLELPF